MAVVLRVLFPRLLMFNTPAAGVALLVAIVLLYRGRTAHARRTSHSGRDAAVDNSV